MRCSEIRHEGRKRSPRNKGHLLKLLLSRFSFVMCPPTQPYVQFSVATAARSQALEQLPILEKNKSQATDSGGFFVAETNCLSCLETDLELMDYTGTRLNCRLTRDKTPVITCVFLSQIFSPIQHILHFLHVLSLYIIHRLFKRSYLKSFNFRF